MKINELMIGDLVIVKTPVEEKATKVAEIYANGIIAEDGGSYLNDEISPIPLTPEILTKNGFRDISNHTLKGAETYCLTMGDSCEIKITYKLGDYLAYDYYDDRWYRQFETSLCYRWCVHNLQHALRLCGIEKEITL